MICLKRNHGEAKYLFDHYIFVFFRLYILHTSELNMRPSRGRDLQEWLRVTVLSPKDI